MGGIDYDGSRALCDQCHRRRIAGCGARRLSGTRQGKYGKQLLGLDVHLDGEYVELTYHLRRVPFDRIRRITGYLVGTLDRFNDGKRAEERDRVKHGMGGNGCE